MALKKMGECSVMASDVVKTFKTLYLYLSANTEENQGKLSKDSLLTGWDWNWVPPEYKLQSLRPTLRFRGFNLFHFGGSENLSLQSFLNEKVKLFT